VPAVVRAMTGTGCSADAISLGMMPAHQRCSPRYLPWMAHDKGYSERDKAAEWIMTEIKVKGGLAYIRKHSPLVFGIPLCVANA
jgi:hypothetical protein